MEKESIFRASAGNGGAERRQVLPYDCSGGVS